MDSARRLFIQEFEGFRVNVPIGQSGAWEVRKTICSDRDAMVSNAVGLVTGTDRYTRPGTYTQLVRMNGDFQEVIVMSDHPCEVADHEPLVTYARQQNGLDHVLINGLGLGVAIELLIDLVDRFTIIEKSQSVINLIAPYYASKYPGRIEVIEHDALTYIPPKDVRYDAVFHDIWDYISPDNLDEMKALHRKYGRRTLWQQSWARKYCESRRTKNARTSPEEMVDIRDVYRSINFIMGVGK